MDKQYKKMINIQTIVFLVSWVIIFLLGADFPPPEGFIYLVMLIIILDIIQYFYLKYLLRDIITKPTFIKNCLFFIVGGIIISVLTSLEAMYDENYQRYIWIGVVTSVSLFYGIILWIINKIIKKDIIKKIN